MVRKLRPDGLDHHRRPSTLAATPQACKFATVETQKEHAGRLQRAHNAAPDRPWAAGEWSGRVGATRCLNVTCDAVELPQRATPGPHQGRRRQRPQRRCEAIGRPRRVAADEACKRLQRPAKDVQRACKASSADRHAAQQKGKNRKPRPLLLLSSAWAMSPGMRGMAASRCVLLRHPARIRLATTVGLLGCGEGEGLRLADGVATTLSHSADRHEYRYWLPDGCCMLPHLSTRCGAAR